MIDSLSEMRLLARDALRYRRQVLALKVVFAARNCTVLMLDDRTSGDNDLQLQSLAHGVIALEQEAHPFGRSRRRLRIVKMRGVAAVEGFHDFRIHRGGIAVYPQLIPVHNPQRSTAPITSGIAELDRLLGGGLTWGTCTLVMGPAGSGKSTLAGQYVTATAGETPAAMFLFDERRSTFINRCEALGMDLQSRIASGHLTLEQIEPGDLSPGEFAHHVRARVEHQGCRMVMIDSLNGYLHAIPTRARSLNTDARVDRVFERAGRRDVAGDGTARHHGPHAVADRRQLSGGLRNHDALLRSRRVGPQGHFRRQEAHRRARGDDP